MELKVIIFFFLIFFSIIILYVSKNETIYKIIGKKEIFKIHIIILLSILIISILYWFYQKKREGMKIEINITPDYNVNELINKAVIPLNIYQTWSTTNLPPKMKNCVQHLIERNPEFTYYLYDDNSCREYIKSNFDKEILLTFDTLIPPAYKADLWRYCILYKKGGIYLDIKFYCEPGFKLIELVDKEYLVLDRPYSNNIDLNNEIKIVSDKNYYKNILNKVDIKFWKDKKVGIYNAVMVCKPNNPIILECIQAIVKNVKMKNYDYNELYVTGPGLLGEKYFKGDYSKLKNFELFNSMNGTYIISKKKIILSHYPEYREEQVKYSKPNSYYHNLWSKKMIYVT